MHGAAEPVRYDKLEARTFAGEIPKFEKRHSFERRLETLRLRVSAVNQ